MSNRRTPAWERLMQARGLTSYRRLAERAGVSHEAVRRAVLGMPSDMATLRAVADALRVDVELVREMRGEIAVDPREWEPPPASRLLTDEERAVLSRLIGVMTAGRDEQKAGGERADSSAPKTPAGESPASNVHALNREDQDPDMDARVAELLAGPHAARRGVPDHLPDDTTGEEPQVGPEED